VQARRAGGQQVSSRRYAQELKRMKNAILIILVFIVAQGTSAFACSCVRPGPTVEDALQGSDFVFMGQCISGELKKVKDPDVGERYLVNFVFEIQRHIKGLSKNEKIVVETGIGFGDCGVPFRLGVSYLVYGHFKNETLATHICTRTRIAGFYPMKIEEKVEKEL
jgi:hypothetical protein